MADSYDEIEARIQAALAFILPDQKPNIAKLARDYAVPASQLWARHNGQRNRSNYEEADHNLSDDQEQALIHIIEHEQADEIYLHYWQLQNWANWILA